MEFRTSLYLSLGAFLVLVCYSSAHLLFNKLSIHYLQLITAP